MISIKLHLKHKKQNVLTDVVINFLINWTLKMNTEIPQIKSDRSRTKGRNKIYISTGSL